MRWRIADASGAADRFALQSCYCSDHEKKQLREKQSAGAAPIQSLTIRELRTNARRLRGVSELEASVNFAAAL